MPLRYYYAGKSILQSPALTLANVVATNGYDSMPVTLGSAMLCAAAQVNLRRLSARYMSPCRKCRYTHQQVSISDSTHKARAPYCLQHRDLPLWIAVYR